MRFFRKLSREGEDYRGHWPVNDDHRTRPLLDVGWRLSRDLHAGVRSRRGG